LYVLLFLIVHCPLLFFEPKEYFVFMFKLQPNLRVQLFQEKVQSSIGTGVEKINCMNM